MWSKSVQTCKHFTTILCVPLSCAFRCFPWGDHRLHCGCSCSHTDRRWPHQNRHQQPVRQPYGRTDHRSWRWNLQRRVHSLWGGWVQTEHFVQKCVGLLFSDTWVRSGPDFVCMPQALIVWRFATMALQRLRVHSVLPSPKAVTQLAFVCMVPAWNVASPTSPTSSQWKLGKRGENIHGEKTQMSMCVFLGVFLLLLW